MSIKQQEEEERFGHNREQDDQGVKGASIMTQEEEEALIS